MVRGRSIAVTSVAGRYQWAETQTMAFGRGRDLPISAQAAVVAFRSMAFIGFPCPKNMVGILTPARRATFAPARDRSRRARRHRDTTPETRQGERARHRALRRPDGDSGRSGKK